MADQVECDRLAVNKMKTYQLWNTHSSEGTDRCIKIRSFRPGDEETIREMFVRGMGEMRMPIIYAALSQFCWCVAPPLCVFSILVESQWSSASVCVGGFLALLLLLFVCVYWGFSRYIRESLKSDLNAIHHTYMISNRTHMWVAECESQIVGMVALTSALGDGNAKTVARLRRFVVLPDFRRRGVAKTLLGVLLQHAKSVGYQKVVLLTTSAQQAALRFYPKMGFSLASKNRVHWALGDFYHYVYSYDL